MNGKGRIKSSRIIKHYQLTGDWMSVTEYRCFTECQYITWHNNIYYIERKAVENYEIKTLTNYPEKIGLYY